MAYRVEGKWWVSHYNFEGAARAQLELPKVVKLVDSTLREADGEGVNGPCLGGPKEKARIAQMLDEAGIAIIEVARAYPVTPEHRDVAVKELKAINELGLRAHKRVIILLGPGYEKKWKEEIDWAVDNGANQIKAAAGWISIPVWKLGRSRDASLSQLIDYAVEAVEYAKDRGIPINISLTDITRTDLNVTKEYYTAVAKAGADIVTVNDTFGLASPLAIRYIVRELKQAFREAKADTHIEIHCHNDYGLATANTLAGIEVGATSAECVANGLGTRAGGADHAEVACALEILYGIKTGIKLEKLTELSRLVADISRIPVPLSKPIVGPLVFCDPTDSHVGFGWLTDPMNPELVGNTRASYLSRRSGRRAFKEWLEKRKISLTDKQLDELVSRFLKELEIRRTLISEEDVLAIVKKVKAQ